MPKHLCLNGIVKNEAARITRMLDSVKDVISTFVIMDTGSTDDTVDLIEKWSEKHEIPGLIAHGTFVNFSQARNEALAAARSWYKRSHSPAFDFLLLMDADMELRVDHPDAFEGLAHMAYMMTQKAGNFSYDNIRLLHAGAITKYVGVTHEYLDITPGGLIGAAYFVDHADGANRANKFARDVVLFEEDLVTNPDDGRTWFYLGNTYKDMGNFVEAERCYRKKLTLPTWDEENWQTQVNLVECLKAQGKEFVTEALAAYQMRPSRAEPLHTLAKHYRLTGQHELAFLFAEKGYSMHRPDDRLFVQDWVYEWGFREELSISGYYSNGMNREWSSKINDGLALDKQVPDYIRSQARRNAVFTLDPLKEFCPSYEEKPIQFFNGKDGWNSLNPCVANRPDGSLETTVRTVNYTIADDGSYMVGYKPLGGWGEFCEPIQTENWLLQLDDDLNIAGTPMPIYWERPEPKFNMVLGLEDMRIFWHRGERHFVACAREQLDSGMPQMLHGILHSIKGAQNVEPLSDGSTCEKNWSPLAIGPDLRYVYRLDTFYRDGKLEKIPCALAVDSISGGSPYIPFASGYLSIVHEAVTHPSHGRRIYQHRFAWYDWDACRVIVSRPFVFRSVQIEFAAGLAMNWRSGKLVVSFGERDASAWLASVSQDDVLVMLGLDR